MKPETLSLAGKIAIVTGAGRESGLGAGIATALARNGASVALNYVSDATGPRASDLADRLCAEFGDRAAVAVQADIEITTGAFQLINCTLVAFRADHVDILINNAGSTLPGATLETPLENIHKQFSVNVFGAINMVREVVPHMPRGGRIVNISSISSKLNVPALPFYSAAKAALDSLSVSWAAEFGRSHGITVNSVAPGPVVTDEQIKYQSSGPEAEAAMRYMIGRTRAAERLGEIADVADAVLLVVQEKSRFITGQYIDVSGGITDL